MTDSEKNIEALMFAMRVKARAQSLKKEAEYLEDITEKLLKLLR